MLARSPSRRCSLPLVLGLGASSAAGAGCPSFRVLHDDRIGPAVLPAGNYTITVAPSAGLTCPAASKLFTRFLEDFDGVLPTPWRVSGSGQRQSHLHPGRQGRLLGRAQLRRRWQGGNTELGALCRNSFTVNSNVVLGPLTFPRGQYLLYIPPRSGHQLQPRRRSLHPLPRLARRPPALPLAPEKPDRHLLQARKPDALRLPRRARRRAPPGPRAPASPSRPELQAAAASSANGLPSESRQIDQRSPGWMTEPPSSRTRSSAAAISGTGK